MATQWDENAIMPASTTIDNTVLRNVRHGIPRMETPTGSHALPRLLVSVRNAAEARAALRGGCDVLDVKEPARGPLGMAAPSALAAVTETARRFSARKPVPVSAALGELTEWQPGGRGRAGCEPPGERAGGSRRSTPATPVLPRLEYFKLGPAGLAERSCWVDEWQTVRTRIEERIGNNAVRWIAVAYADREAARAPSPEEIAEAAAELGCAGLLVDTWGKSRGRLLGHLSVGELGHLRTRVHCNGMTLAVAGRLTRACLPDVLSARPDIVAVRSAVCRRQQRTGEVEESEVRAFKAAIAHGICPGASVSTGG